MKLNIFGSGIKIVITTMVILLVFALLQFLASSIGWLFEKPPQQRCTNNNVAVINDCEKTIKEKAAKEFTADGKVFLVDKWDESRCRIYDANSKKIWEGNKKEKPFDFLMFGQNFFSFDARDLESMYKMNLEFSSGFNVPVKSTDDSWRVWKYDLRKDYFVGLDSIGQIVGYMGAKGFAKSKAKIEPFCKFKKLRLWRHADFKLIKALWMTERKIYEIDFVNEKVIVVFDSDKEKIKEAYVNRSWLKKKDGYRPLLVCKMTDGKRHLVLKDTNEKIVLPEIKPKKDLRLKYFKVAAIDDGLFVMVLFRDPWPDMKNIGSEDWFGAWRKYNSKSHNQELTLYKLNDGGAELEMMNNFSWVKTPRKIAHSREKFWPSEFHDVISNLSPVVYGAIGGIWHKDLRQLSRTNDSVRSALAGLILHWRAKNMVANVIVSLIAVSIAFVHGLARRKSWAGFAGWLVFVFIFNVAGLIIYLMLNHRPVIICQNCNSKRAVNNKKCRKCGQSLEMPKNNGFEIVSGTI